MMRTRIRGAALAFAVCVSACSASSDGTSTSEPVASIEAADKEAPDDEPEVEVESAENESDDVAAAPDDETESDAGAEEPSVDDENAEPEARYLSGDPEFLFDQDQLHTFELNLSEDALAELEADPAAEEYVDGSLTFNGETLDSIGIRYKGSIGAFLGCTAGNNPFTPSGAKVCTKLSMKLKINWQGSSDEFYGQRRVQLHSMNLDPTLMRDRLGYWLFEQAGVPAPRATHARVMINGEFAGVFALIEQIDGRFTRDRFDDGKGNLYKEAWPTVADGSIRPTEDLIDALETNEDEDPTTELVESFAAVVIDSGAATDADVARSVFEEWTDVEATVAYAVVDRAIRNDDGVFHWYCFEGPCEPHNFFVYEETEASRIHFIPWDLDNAFDNLRAQNAITYIPDDFGDTQADCQPFSSGPLPITQRSAACDPIIAAWAQLDDEFERIDEEFRAGPFSIEQVRAQIEVWRGQIAPLVAEASGLYDDEPTPEEWEFALDRLLEDIELANSESGT